MHKKYNSVQCKQKYFPNMDFSVWLRKRHEQVTDPVLGHISFGKIPLWLKGSLVSNGPGGVDSFGEDSCKHLFDAPGLLQKITVNNGCAVYSSRFVETRSYKRNSALNRLILSEFGTVGIQDPCQTIFGKIASVFLGPLELSLTDNANISIHPFGDEIYTLAETGFAHRIDIDSLKTTETINVNEEIGIIHHSSHPHICGTKVYNVGEKLGLRFGLHYIITEMEVESNNSISYTSPSKKQGLNRNQKKSHETKQGMSPWSRAKVVATIPSRWPLSMCYMHSFALTQSYFILIEQPLCTFLPSVSLSQIKGDKPIASCLKFYPEEDTIIHVVSRDSNDASSVNKPLKSFHVPSFFYFHTINAFDMRDENTGETIIALDVCCYNEPNMIEAMYTNSLRNASSNPDYANMLRAKAKRFVLKFDDFNLTKAGTPAEVECETIVDIGCETPRINDHFDGKEYNYFYAMTADVGLQNPGTLIKVNVQKKSYESWCEPNAYPGEPVFVPRPGSHKEDDGIVIASIIYGGENVSGPNRTSLIILNAASWDMIAKVDFECESSIPKSLHGWFFPDKNRHPFSKNHTNDHSTVIQA